MKASVDDPHNLIASVRACRESRFLIAVTIDCRVKWPWVSVTCRMSGAEDESAGMISVTIAPQGGDKPPFACIDLTELPIRSDHLYVAHDVSKYSVYLVGIRKAIWMEPRQEVVYRGPNPEAAEI